ncbi:MAG: methylenetetrahydrofolate reductase [NAD(P)H] [Oscillospiraceae bacterium]
MKLSSLFGKGKTIFSFEVFPPKKTSPIDTIYNTLDELKDLSPAFISVTYGAGGNPADTTTCDIAAYISRELKINSAAHLTCVYSTKEGVLQQLAQFKERGVENILALRGDINPDIPRKHEFEYASDLTAFIKANGDFGISGACYPECHLESENIVEDIKHLKMKVDAGAEHLISQLFFDNAAFYSFIEKARIAGINVPIEAGIMPVVNGKQIQRMVSTCGAGLPTKFTKIMQRYENNPEALRDAGIAYAVDQIVDLISNGVDGIHLYTMNNPYVARKISESIKTLL